MTTKSPRRKDIRRERIVALLRTNPAVRIAELAREFGVSTETVRRDLDELGEIGAVNRTYGGAARAAMGYEAAVNERLQERITERGRIGRLASSLVEPGDVLMIDGGSTTIHFARHLAAEGERLTVLTNSLGVAAALGQNPSIKVVMCPGDYHPYEGIVTGPETITFLERFVVDKAFIGASGLTDDGPSEVHSSAAWVKRRMLGQAEQNYLLLDATKFNKARHEKICRLAEIGNLVSDRRPKGRLRTALDRASVTLHVETD